MDTLLQRKTAVITGAGSGIGQASAYALAREGASVAILDFDEEAGRRTANALTAELAPRARNSDSVTAVAANVIVRCAPCACWNAWSNGASDSTSNVRASVAERLERKTTNRMTAV